ncbi:GGDEF domain-containing protein [Alicyclobacillus cycloheptanicus]|uniref:Diguanylate cyclase (GGDEF)-like protein n=1 Tax=Alicyclobacillus cycloheptanicus TaxID=1457 RepID=A0ABT9XHN2_9BACL|nr:GGDEF domain-containing protein [Alicyclobacillus cycloheptanicus]MDQ0189620.1 diguanylate cyclase (GGDEF)-like protein [Alicyclobacillus cycloheptanicus]WDL99929.1 GGDEF domain-containing protein [Alicyclobacillus cycloheptanicus]
MDKHLEALFNTSREWTKYKRGSEVAKAAIEFLRTQFQVDAGFVNYERHPRASGADYLREPLRWFTSWGYSTPDAELRKGIAESMHFQSQLKLRQWFSVDELPSVWSEINRVNGIRQVGIWLLHFDDAPVGVFVLARKSAHFDDSQAISFCMAHISMVIEMVLQRRLAEELSVRDPLTGLMNRRGFLCEFDHLVQSQQDTPLMLCVLDVDRFKQVNDEFGHQAGDELLAKVGDILQTNTKARGGICARIGGDEFVLLAHLGARDVYRAAKIVIGWYREEGIRVSVGAAAFGPDGLDFDACYRKADQRLYQMKAGVAR